jgi:UDP-glucose 4-epimerase
MRGILVTGGLGFIGSEAVVSLLKAGYEPIIVDNLYNSKISVLDRIKQITGFLPKFYNADCCDIASMRSIFQSNRIDGVINFAG